MELKLKLNWTVFARGELHKIIQYHKNKSSLKTAKNIVEEISKQELILEKFPFVGQKEELLADSKEDFRYFLCFNHKILCCPIKKKARLIASFLSDNDVSKKKI